MEISDSLLNLFNRIDGTVCIVGSMNADYTVTTQCLPRPGETVTGSPLCILPGGKSSNQAAAAARLGASVRIFAAVGSDSNAAFLLNELAKTGVDTTYVQHVTNMSTGTTVITVDETGENTIVYSPGSNACVDVDYIRSSYEALISASVLGLCLESPIETVTETARICHDAGVTVLLNDSPFVTTLPDELIEAADILLVNEHEMAQLLDITEPSDGDWRNFDWILAMNRMRKYGFDRSIVTLGSEGAVVLDATAQGLSPVQHITPIRVNVRDTTGCGDAFMGTILAGLASGFELCESAQLASYVSAYAATGYGAQTSYGTVDQICTLFSETNN